MTLTRSSRDALKYEYALQALKYAKLEKHYYILALVSQFSLIENRPYAGFKPTVYKTPFRWIHDKNKLTAVNSDALNHLSYPILIDKASNLPILDNWATLKKGGHHG